MAKMLRKKIKLKKRNSPLIILHELIHYGDKLDVYRGSTRKMKVAVKRIRIRPASLLYRLSYQLSCIFTGEIYNGIKLCNTASLKDVFKEIYIMNTVKFHKNVLQILDFRVTKYHFSIVMELCTYTLEEFRFLNAKRGEFLIPEELVLHLMAPIISAVAHMHSLKFAHLDIKPDNVFITRDGVPKLGDFDMSFCFRQVKEVFLVGTEFYMGPEMYYLEQNVTPKADVFSIGATCILCMQETSYNTRFRDFSDSTIKFDLKERNLRLQELYCLKEKDNRLSAGFISFLKGLIQWQSKDRYSWKQILNNPVILKSLEAWNLKEKSILYRKRSDLFKKQALKLLSG